MSFKGISNISLDVSRKCLYTLKCKNMHHLIDWIKNHDWGIFISDYLGSFKALAKIFILRGVLSKADCKARGEADNEMMQSDRGKLLSQGVQGKLKVEKFQNERYFSTPWPSNLQAKT